MELHDTFACPQRFNLFQGEAAAHHEHLDFGCEVEHDRSPGVASETHACDGIHMSFDLSDVHILGPAFDHKLEPIIRLRQIDPQQ